MRTLTVCRFCGERIDPSFPLLHQARCDGQQGHVEAAINAAADAPVLDPIASRRATEAGIARVTLRARDDYKAMLIAAVRDVALTSCRVTSDLVWQNLGTAAMQQGNPSALGHAFREAAKLGYIRLMPGSTESLRPSMHHKPLRLWESRICSHLGRHAQEGIPA